MRESGSLARWGSATVLAAVPFACGLAVRLWYGGRPVLPSDDFYIALHAARLLGTGGDPSYPEASALTGVTSPLHVTALRLFMVFVPPEWAGELLTWAGALLFLRGAAGIMVRTLPGRFERAALMIVACLVASTPFHMASGQETIWAMAAVVWGVYWTASDVPARQRLPWLAGVLPWLRPDLAFWSVGLFGWRWWTAPQRRARDVAIVATCAAAYVAVWWWATGSILPNTVQAKRDFFGESVLPLAIRVTVGCFMIGQFAVHAGAACLLLPGAVRTSPGRLAFAVAAAFWLAFSFGGAAGLNHNYFRYMQPFVMPLFLLGASGWSGAVRKVVLAISVAGVLFLAPERWTVYRESQAIVVDAQEAAAAWLRANTVVGTSVLVHDAGYLSEHTSAVLTDLVGLKTPSAARVHAAITGPSAGERRGEAIHEIACRAKPEYFVAFSGWEGYFSLTYDLMRHGWEPVPLVRTGLPTREGRREVTLYRLRLSPRCPPSVAASPPSVDGSRTASSQSASVVQK